MTERVVAVDIDLRQFAAWDSIAGAVCCEEPTFETILQWLDYNQLGGHVETVLIECASPIVYSGPKKQSKRQAWTIFNSMMTSLLVDEIWRNGRKLKTLVAPSSTWTKGLREPIRHKLAGVVEPKFPRAKGRHDLKECQAMIWTYRQEPDLWQPLETYLESL